MNKIWIALSFVALITIFWACKKEKEDPVVVAPVAKYVTITAKADSGGVIEPSGIDSVRANSSTKKIYTIKPDSGFIIKSVKINNVDQYPVTDKYELSYLSVDENIEVEFESADYLLITEGKWYMKSSYNQFTLYNDTTWVKYDLAPRQYTDYLVFTMDYYYYTYDVDGKVIGGPSKYFISGKTLNFVGGDGLKTKITYLDKNKMIWESFYGGVISKLVFTHQKGIYVP
jgi:hypothetical protein